MSVALNNGSAPRWSIARKYHLHLKLLSSVAYYGFPQLGGASESVPNPPLNVELVHIASVLDIAQRDKNVGLSARPIAIDWHTRGAAVID